MHEEDDIVASSNPEGFGVSPVLNRSGGHNHTKRSPCVSPLPVLVSVTQFKPGLERARPRTGVELGPDRG